MADDEINVKIVFDDSNASEKIQGVNKSLEDLGSKASKTKDNLNDVEQSTSKASKSMGDFGQATEQTAKKMGEASEKLKEAHSGVKNLATEAYYASYGFGLLGDTVGQAASQASNFFQLFESFEKLSPAIMGAMVALTGLVLTFESLNVVVDKIHTSIDDFSKDQTALVSLNALIKNQGGAWQENEKKVNEYAESLAKAGTFAKTDIMDGMREMLTAGVSVNDMMRSQEVAMDLAKAKGISLVSAETELAQAYDGRLIGLKRLGLVTKEEVQNGLPYEELLDRITARMGGTASEVMDTYTGKMANLKNITEANSVAFGSALNPALEQIATMMIGAENALKPLIDDFQRWAIENKALISEGLTALGKILSEIASVVLPAVIHAIEGTMSSLASFAKWYTDNETEIKYFFSIILGSIAVASLTALPPLFATIEAGMTSMLVATGPLGLAIVALGALMDAMIADSGQTWSQYFAQVAEGWNNLVIGIDKAIKSLNDSLDSLNSHLGIFSVSGKKNSILDHDIERRTHIHDHDADMGGSSFSSDKGWGTPQSSAFTPSSHEIQGTKSGGSPQENWHGSPLGDEVQIPSIEKSSQVQRQLETALKGSTVGEKELAEAVKLATNAHEEATAKVRLHTKELADLEAQHKLLNDAVAKEQSMWEADIKTSADATITRDNAKSSYENLKAQMETVVKPTQDQKDELAKLKKEYDDANKTVAHMNSETEALSNSIRSNTVALQENIDKTRAKKNEDAEASATLAREKAKSYDDAIKASTIYYAMANQQTQEDLQTADMSAKQKLAYFVDLFQKKKAIADADQKNNHDAYAEDEQLAQQSYGKVLEAYKALKQQEKEEAKKAQDQEIGYVNSFLDNVVLKHKSMGESIKSILDDIQKAYLKTFSTDIVKKLFGNNNGNSDSSSGGLTGLLNLGGSSSSVAGKPDGTASNAFHVILAGTPGQAINSSNPLQTGLQQVAGQDLSSNEQSVGSELLDGLNQFPAKMGFGNKSFAGAMEGMAIGGAVSGMLGGNAGNSQIGSALGSALGSLIPGVGTVIGGIAGGLLGGMFGPHETPEQQPDQSDSEWQKISVNLSSGSTGWLTSGGQQAPDAQFSPYANQLSQSAQIVQWMQQVNTAGMNSQQLALISKLKQLDPTGSAEGLGIASERQGIATLNSGQTISVKDLDALIQNQEIMQSATGNQIASFSFNRINGGTASNLQQQSDSGLGKFSIYNNSTQSGSTSSNSQTITINNNGTVVGSDGLQSLANQIAQIITQNRVNNVGNQNG